MRMSELWADMVYAPTLPSDEEIKRAGEKMLRDQFAIAALPALIQLQSIETVQEAARASYYVADAMLKAREEK